jgi:23S rRNA pseudouridine1911/1915/1917 synthase
MNRWRVDETAAGGRLDKFLAAAERLGSRGRAADALARGKIFLNDREATAEDAAHPLESGDVVRVWMDRPGSARRKAALGARRDLPTVYEDDDLVILNKPAGVLAVPLERRDDARSVFDDLREYLRTRRPRRRPFVVHRIDRDTSGLVVFAKSAAAQSQLKAQFKRHAPDRIYIAVVYGHVSPSAGTWRDRLVWDKRALIQKETHPSDPHGKEAISHYRVVELLKEASVVEVRLVTGRRNQIRLQARLRGHTLVGERRYTFGPDSLRPIAFPRQALHAQQLAFRHPTSGAELHFEAPLPDDMRELIERLKVRRQPRRR